MSKRDRGSYQKYKETAPFMFPLPKFAALLATATVKGLFGKNQLENRREILVTFAVYCLVFILLSLPFVLTNWPPDHEWLKWPYNVWPFQTQS